YIIDENGNILKEHSIKQCNKEDGSGTYKCSESIYSYDGFTFDNAPYYSVEYDEDNNIITEDNGLAYSDPVVVNNPDGSTTETVYAHDINGNEYKASETITNTDGSTHTTEWYGDIITYIGSYDSEDKMIYEKIIDDFSTDINYYLIERNSDSSCCKFSYIDKNDNVIDTYNCAGKGCSRDENGNWDQPK
ncbi:hypothetical protein IJS77_02070, partial [bacterium]|nr:hypothetical protein [bacterium]